MVELNIERLDWDSVFFGYEVGKIQINCQETMNLDIFFKQATNYKLIYVFSNIALADSRFELVDSKVIFHQKITEENLENVLEKDVVIESFNNEVHDFKQIKQLALESGIYSRFFIDQNFKSNEYVRLYSRWIENAVKKINAFDVVVATKNNNIIGFTTLNGITDGRSDIGLVAVSKEFRGLGLGKKIINESILRARKAGFKEIQVITQSKNIAAIRLYNSTNFKIEKITNIYHLWNI